MKQLYTFIFLFLLIFVAANSDAQEYQSKLQEAEDYYRIGKLSEMREIVWNIPEMNNSSVDEKVWAYRLMAMYYLAYDDLEKANVQIRKIFELKKNYEADNRDLLRYIEWVKIVQEKLSEGKISSVSKTLEDPLEAPATVMVITEEDIKKRGYVDLEAMFGDLPGFDVTHTFASTYSNIYQRGYRSNNTDRTIFLVDGMEDNDLYYNQAFISRQYSITNVKRVEIVYGPASTMYGANAFVGVINVITKEPNDFLKDRHLAVSANTGYGTYNTKYADVTLAGKRKGLSFTSTVRRFYSDERDLSKFPEFNYNPNDYDTTNYKKILAVKYTKTDSVTYSKSPYFTLAGGKTVLTDKGDSAARAYDKAAFAQKVNGNAVGYSNISSHWYFNGRMQTANFVLGYQYWRCEQGSTNYNNDWRRPGAKNGSVWTPQQTVFYVNYNKQIDEKLSIINLAQYKISSFDDNSRIVDLKSYFNGQLKAIDLAKDRPARWETEYYYQNSRQFRNEFKIDYTPTPHLDLIAGIEVRNSSVYGDFRKTKTDTATVVEIGKSPLDSVAGGNDFVIYDVGVYLQGNYKLNKYTKITLGGRYDFNRVRKTQGYGSVFNPRVALVFAPKDYVLKFIYARAFKDPSNFQKYSTSAQRMLANPDLKPEIAQNFEFSAAYRGKKDLFVEMSAYRANYTNAIGTAMVDYKGGKTGQYQALGALRIYGVQADMTYNYNNHNIYANYTYTHPESEILDAMGKPTGRYERIGDISSHHFNMGVNGSYFDKLNVNLRMRFYTERKVGAGTNVPLNPYKFPAVALFDGAVSVFKVWKTFDVQLVCNNILNKDYFDPGVRESSGTSYTARTPQRERNFMLRVFYNFQ